MRRGLCLLIAISLPSGCVYQEITAPHTNRGGVIRAALNGGATVATTALAKPDGETMTVSGSAADLVFGLVASDDGNGRSGKAALAEPGGSLTLAFIAGGRNKLEVYAHGSGCRAEAGTVVLRIDAGGTLSGDFDVSGVQPNGGAPCVAEGTLEAVPVMRE